MIRRVWTLAGREVRMAFRGGATWVFFAVFPLLTGLGVFVLGDFFAVGQADVRPFFSILPWLLALLAPALTMRAVAEEERKGTLELFLAAPVLQVELVAAKAKAAGWLLLFALAATLPIPAVVHAAGAIDPGPVAAGYLGAWLLALVFASAGLAASAAAPSAPGAYALGAAGSLFLLVLDFEPVLRLVPGGVREALAAIAPRGRFEAMGRGVVALSDLAVLGAWSSLFLGLAWVFLCARRGDRAGDTARDRRLAALFWTTTVLLAAVLLARLPGQIDVTREGRFTLSPATKRLLAEAPEGTTIRVYLSRSKLPAELRPMARDVEDLLAEVERTGGGRVVVEVVDPSAESRAAEEAGRLGIRPVPIGVVSRDEYREAAIYQGLAVFAGGGVEAMPRIDPARFEYQLVLALRAALGAERPRVLFSGGEMHSLYGDYGLVREALDRLAEVRAFSPSSDEAETELAEADLVVLADASLAETRIVEYVERGGKLLVFGGQTPGVGVALLGDRARDALERLGVRFLPGTLLDASCEVVRVPRRYEGAVLSVPTAFPALVRVPPEGIAEDPLTRDLEALLLPWPQATAPAETLPPGARATILVRSSGRNEIVPIPPTIDAPPPPPGPGLPQGLAVHVEGLGPGGGEVIAFGSHWAFSALLFSDPTWMLPNLLALENFVDGLTTGGELVELRAKVPVARGFRRPYTPGEKAAFKWTGTLAGPVAVGLFALGAAARRRRRHSA